MNKSAAAFRSIAASVNIPPQIKPDAFIITEDKIISDQTDLLATLGKCKSVKPVQSENDIPKGCGIATISDGAIKLYLELASHIDVKKELARLQKKLDELNKLKHHLQVKIDDKNRDKIPEKVRNDQDNSMVKFIDEEKIIQNAMKKIQ